MKAWYDDIDCATLQRIKAYSAFNDATSKNLMIQTMYEYREKEIKDFKKTNHELAELCILRKKHIKDLEKENAELKEKQNFSTQYYQGEKAKEKLAEAKKIIIELYQGLDKLYLSGLSDKQIAFIEQLQDKTEQFLSED